MEAKVENRAVRGRCAMTTSAIGQDWNQTYVTHLVSRRKMWGPPNVYKYLFFLILRQM